MINNLIKIGYSMLIFGIPFTFYIIGCDVNNTIFMVYIIYLSISLGLILIPEIWTKK